VRWTCRPPRKGAAGAARRLGALYHRSAVEGGSRHLTSLSRVSWQATRNPLHAVVEADRQLSMVNWWPEKARTPEFGGSASSGGRI
jgi:hypothetical protein